MNFGFCYDREQGKHGEIKHEWSWEWGMFIPVCRKHFFRFRSLEEIKKERGDGGESEAIREKESVD
jgi:hypothetical protein